jgi:PAS domain-containing protein
MYRLTVIAGPTNAQPARGSTFAVGNGSFSIGRHSQNEIVLQSGNVSKKHCVLVVDNSRIELEDQGSSNGTFVNDFLTSQKILQAGDRIRVGEFILELTNVKDLALAPKREKNHLALVSDTYQHSVPGQLPGGAPAFSAEEEAPMPKDPIGKARYFFDRYALPYFFGFNERFEWRFVIASLFGLFLVLNLFISISPLMSEQERAIERELAHRAQGMARELAERNTPFIAAKAESKLDLGTFGKAWGTRATAIVDMESKILAPAAKAGRYFESGSEAAVAIQARKLFVEGNQQQGIVKKSDPETIVAIEPIQVFDAALGKNKTEAMAIVSIDTTLGVTSGAHLLMVYAHSLVLSLFVGFFVFYLIYRITLKPLQEMNRKADQALRGEPVDFKSSVYFSEIEPLWNVVDSALKRIPRGDEEMGMNGGGMGGAPSLNASDLAGPLRAMAIASPHGFVALDAERNVVFMNSVFEEITGVRLESSEGQALAGVVRDQAFSALINDLCDRVAPGTEGMGEDFEFSGLPFQVLVSAFGSFGDPKCFIFNLVRKEE